MAMMSPLNHVFANQNRFLLTFWFFLWYKHVTFITILVYEYNCNSHRFYLTPARVGITIPGHVTWKQFSVMKCNRSNVTPGRSPELLPILLSQSITIWFSCRYNRLSSWNWGKMLVIWLFGILVALYEVIRSFGPLYHLLHSEVFCIDREGSNRRNISKNKANSLFFLALFTGNP
jgi:hypothetical protein